MGLDSYQNFHFADGLDSAQEFLLLHIILFPVLNHDSSEKLFQVDDYNFMG